MLAILLLLLVTAVLGLPCSPSEIYIRKQTISFYAKFNDTKVSTHLRNAHFRQIERQNYFQASTTQKLVNLKPKIKMDSR